MRSHVLIATLMMGGCVSYVPPTSGQQPTKPEPTEADPFAGLPAISADGKTLALPTFSTVDGTQERSVAFVAVGDAESAGRMFGVSAPTAGSLAILRQQLEGYSTLPWVITPNDPPLPLRLSVKTTEMLVDGDPRASLQMSVRQAGTIIGTDLFQVEAESETSPEKVVAVGATVLWNEPSGFAYVRYDIVDGVGRDSQWRLVALQKPAPGATATTR